MASGAASARRCLQYRRANAAPLAYVSTDTPEISVIDDPPATVPVDAMTLALRETAGETEEVTA